MKALKFWIHSCLHVALCAAILTLGSAIFFESENPVTLALFCFFGTWSVYLAQRIFKGKSAGLTEVHQHILSHKKVYTVVAILSGLIAAGITSLLGLPYIVMAGVGFVATLLYIYFPGSKKNLRNSPWAKIAIVTAVWTLITLGFPLANANDLPSGYGWQILERFAFVALITVPFDIRDILRDAPKQKNLPILLGLAKTRMLMAILLAVPFTFLVLYFADGWYSIQQSAVLAVVYAVSGILALRAKQSDPEMYFTFGLESTSLLLGLVLCYFESFA